MDANVKTIACLLIATLGLLSVPTVAADDDMATQDTENVGCDLVAVYVVGQFPFVVVYPMPENLDDCLDP